MNAIQKNAAQIKRLSNGSIDYKHYLLKARQLRSSYLYTSLFVDTKNERPSCMNNIQDNHHEHTTHKQTRLPIPEPILIPHK